MQHQRTDDISIPAASRTACPRYGRVVVTGGCPAFAPVSCSNCQATLTAPGMLGDLLLLRPLGAGHLWTTYKAFDRSLGRDVAVKVLSTRDDDDGEQVGAFLAGGRAMAAMDYPNVVQVYALGETAGREYIVMEFVPGGAMGRLIRASRGMDEARALDLVRGAVGALQAAAADNVHHGDVKPSNILLGDDGQVKLADFALWRPGDMESVADTAGTSLYYAAPERLVGRPAYVRSDIYSLGAVLFHALTGARLVPPSPTDTVGHNVWCFADSMTADGIRALRRSLNPVTADLVARMLHTEPTERPQNYPELLAELGQASDALTGRVPIARRATQMDLIKHALRPAPPDNSTHLPAEKHVRRAQPASNGKATPTPAPLPADATPTPRGRSRAAVTKVTGVAAGLAAPDATPRPDRTPTLDRLREKPRRLAWRIAVLVAAFAGAIAGSVLLTLHWAPTAPPPAATPHGPQAVFAANPDYPAVADDIPLTAPVVYCVCADLDDPDLREAVNAMILASARSLNGGRFGLVHATNRGATTTGRDLLAADTAGLSQAEGFLSLYAPQSRRTLAVLEATARMKPKTIVLITTPVPPEIAKPLASDLNKRQVRLVVLGLAQPGPGRRALANLAQSVGGQCRIFDPQALARTWARHQQ